MTRLSCWNQTRQGGLRMTRLSLHVEMKQRERQDDTTELQSLAAEGRREAASSSHEHQILDKAPWPASTLRTDGRAKRGRGGSPKGAAQGSPRPLSSCVNPSGVGGVAPPTYIRPMFDAGRGDARAAPAGGPAPAARRTPLRPTTSLSSPHSR